METKSKQKLRELLKEEGFHDILSEIGTIGRETESIIKSRNDSDLAFSFEVMFCILSKCYQDKIGVKRKREIEQFLGTESVKKSLEIVHWQSDGHHEAMKRARVILEKFVTWRES